MEQSGPSFTSLSGGSFNPTASSSTRVGVLRGWISVSLSFLTFLFLTIAYGTAWYTTRQYTGQNSSSYTEVNYYFNGASQSCSYPTTSSSTCSNSSILSNDGLIARNALLFAQVLSVYLLFVNILMRVGKEEWLAKCYLTYDLPRTRPMFTMAHVLALFSCFGAYVMVANSIYLSYHPTTASELADNSYHYGPGFALTVVATLMALVQHVLMNFDDDATVAVPARMPVTSSSVATNVDDVNASSYQAAP